MKDLTTQHTNIRQQYDATNDEIRDLQLTLQQPQQQLQKCDQELRRLQDSRQVYLQKLETSRFKHEAQAHKWITQNKALFAGEVYGPIGIELQVLALFALLYICYF